MFVLVPSQLPRKNVSFERCAMLLCGLQDERWGGGGNDLNRYIAKLTMNSVPYQVHLLSFGLFFSIPMMYCKIMALFVKIISNAGELLSLQCGGMENEGNVLVGAAYIQYQVVTEYSLVASLFANIHSNCTAQSTYTTLIARRKGYVLSVCLRGRLPPPQRNPASMSEFLPIHTGWLSRVQRVWARPRCILLMLVYLFFACALKGHGALMLSSGGCTRPTRHSFVTKISALLQKYASRYASRHCRSQGNTLYLNVASFFFFFLSSNCSV